MNRSTPYLGVIDSILNLFLILCLHISPDSWWLPGQVPWVFLARFQRWLVLVYFLRLRGPGSGHPAGLVPQGELELTVSQFILWCFNHYTKLALALNVRKPFIAFNQNLSLLNLNPFFCVLHRTQNERGFPLCDVFQLFEDVYHISHFSVIFSPDRAILWSFHFFLEDLTSSLTIIVVLLRHSFNFAECLKVSGLELDTRIDQLLTVIWKLHFLFIMHVHFFLQPHHFLAHIEFIINDHSMISFITTFAKPAIPYCIWFLVSVYVISTSLY